MNKLLSNLLWGRNSKLNGVLALGIVVLVATGCACFRDLDLGKNRSENNSDRTTSNTTTTSDDKQDGSLPSSSTIKDLVKDTTSDFKDAIDTGNFSIIHAKSSTDFQASYTEAQMKNAFSTFTREKRRVVPILEKAIDMDPQFTPEPYIRTEKGISVLVVTGRYATKPLPVNIEYEYVFRGGEWKLLKLIVKIT